VLGGARNDLPNMDQFNQRQANLPHHAGLTDAEVETVIAAVKAGW